MGHVNASMPREHEGFDPVILSRLDGEESQTTTQVAGFWLLVPEGVQRSTHDLSHQQLATSNLYAF
jgi:hypothetical protein